MERALGLTYMKLNTSFKKEPKKTINIRRNKSERNYTTDKSLDDLKNCLPDQQSVQEKRNDGGRYILASCPLPHNHKNGDRSPSFILSEVTSNKHKDENNNYKQIVVFSCLSGCCEQSELGNFFKRGLGL